VGLFGKKKRKPASRRQPEVWEKIKDQKIRDFVKKAATEPNIRVQLIKKKYGIEIVPLTQEKLDKMAIRKAIFERAEAMYSDKTFSPEELEDELFSELGETLRTEKEPESEEPAGDEPYRRPYPVRHQLPVQNTGRAVYRMPSPGTGTSTDSASSNKEAYERDKKAVIDFFNKASGQAGSGAKTYVMEINGKSVEMPEEVYFAFRDQQKRLDEINAQIAAVETGESKKVTPEDTSEADADEISPVVSQSPKASGEQKPPKPAWPERKTQEEHPDKPT